MTRAMDKNMITAVICSDFSKAFDRLNHDTLISILHYIGCNESAYKIINSFLTDRIQEVVYNIQYSDFNRIIQEFPQDSMIGPLLYTIYTVFFLYELNSICRSYAETEPI